ncbi:MAG: phenylalanine--tRNA ligase subunit beta [Gammaproteobacteria bacterium]|nr:phenylalanine--tRNA ligase subunit beta [Gammaproteobacteria bacterium]
MKCSENWLREWVNPALSREQLANILTMGGIEVESIDPLINLSEHIIVGKILSLEKHPQADNLKICQVEIDKSETLQIVCGAENASPNLYVAVAKIGACLPNGTEILKSEIRGITSSGMLLSAAELNLTDNNEAIIEFPFDSEVGVSVKEYLKLEDYIFDLSITPNRGDCLSIKGIAREIAALTETTVKPFSESIVKSMLSENFNLKILAPAACPRYAGRILRNVKPPKQTPVWLAERLRRSGFRSIHPIVDVTNYVMLEMGQPMHAFDFEKINGGIEVRFAKQGEKIKLLDDSEQTLDDETLVIADHQAPVAIAGVMGGMASSVTLTTQDILLESAYFPPQIVARQRQFYHLNSESSYRFERGIDSNIQIEALERATALILEIAGGEASPVIVQQTESYLPSLVLIDLQHHHLNAVLGKDIPRVVVDNIFKRLDFKVQSNDSGWQVAIPSYRPDLLIPEDLIEEIARLYGYENIEARIPQSVLYATHHQFNEKDWSPLRKSLAILGFHEIISYSFVEADLQNILDPNATLKTILNPISADMTVMRSNLWPGLIQSYIYNRSRQQDHIHLFEIGACYLEDKNTTEVLKLGLIVGGSADPIQWGAQNRPVDFYDLKGSIEILIKNYTHGESIHYISEAHPALHPGQTAAIVWQGQKIGILGAIHPSLKDKLGLTETVYLAEINLSLINYRKNSQFEDISKFPEIRRDLALIVNQAIPAAKIQDTIKLVAGDWLKEVFIFDVYQGKGISPGFKSIALALILQHPHRTLVDDEVAELVERVIIALRGQTGAELRS